MYIVPIVARNCCPELLPGRRNPEMPENIVRRSPLGLLLLILTLALPAGAVTVSDPIAAVDNLPPEPVSNVTAVVVVEGVEVRWSLSPSGGRRPAPTGDVTSGGTFVSVNDVAAYQVLRSENGGDFDLVGTAAPGDSLFLDNTAVSGASIIYGVIALDATGNESAGTESAPISLGPPPSLVLDPRTDVDFGEVAADASVTHVITVTNAATEANATLTLTTAIGEAVVGVSWLGFSVEPPSLILAPGASAELTVTFSAMEAGNTNGAYAGLLTLTSNDADPQDRLVEIEFEATLVGGIETPEIQISPLSLLHGSWCEVVRG